ncbi:hypothetical protein I316_03045 [Kwoniella heveanensis BCC8398]|uniref:Uncharacterized protein n=1 Tax=Kwoniella heveanensis BCC8398 TaxID=1296120 RepID=A0A1B9GVR9_9TREE|nr:hypothetical protein I316_03045 [Kwoniella heveanensis BCC8398]
MPRPSRARKAPPVFGNMVSSDQAYGSGDEEYDEDIQLADDDGDNDADAGEDGDDDEDEEETEYGSEVEDEGDDRAAASESEDDDRNPKSKSKYKSGARGKNNEKVAPKSSFKPITDRSKGDKGGLSSRPKSSTGSAISSAAKSKGGAKSTVLPAFKGKVQSTTANKVVKKIDLKSASSRNQKRRIIQESDEEGSEVPTERKDEDDRNDEDGGMDPDDEQEGADHSENDVENDVDTGVDKTAMNKNNKSAPTKAGTNKAVTVPTKTAKATSGSQKQVASTDCETDEEAFSKESDGEAVDAGDVETSEDEKQSHAKSKAASKPTKKPVPSTKKTTQPLLKPKSPMSDASTKYQNGKDAPDSKGQPRKNRITLAPSSRSAVVPFPKPDTSATKKGKFTGLKPKTADNSVASTSKPAIKPSLAAKKVPERPKEPSKPVKPVKARPTSTKAKEPKMNVTKPKSETRGEVDKARKESGTEDRDEHEHQVEEAEFSEKAQETDNGNNGVNITPQSAESSPQPVIAAKKRARTPSDESVAEPVKTANSKNGNATKPKAIGKTVAKEVAADSAQSGREEDEVTPPSPKKRDITKTKESKAEPSVKDTPPVEEARGDADLVIDFGDLIQPANSQLTSTSNEVEEEIEYRSQATTQGDDNSDIDHEASQVIVIEKKDASLDPSTNHDESSQETIGDVADQKKRKRTASTPCPPSKKTAPAPAQKIPSSVRRDIIALFLTPEYLRTLSFTSIQTDECKSAKLSRHWRQVLGPDLKHYFSGDKSSTSPKKGKQSSAAGGINKDMRSKIWKLISDRYEKADWKPLEDESGISTTKLKRHLRDVMNKEAKKFIEG